jgi:hypothetical protein
MVTRIVQGILPVKVSRIKCTTIKLQDCKTAGLQDFFPYYNWQSNSSDPTQKLQNCKTAELQNSYPTFPPIRL